jgi:hypothetical protein
MNLAATQEDHGEVTLDQSPGPYVHLIPFFSDWQRQGYNNASRQATRGSPLDTKIQRTLGTTLELSSVSSLSLLASGVTKLVLQW